MRNRGQLLRLDLVVDEKAMVRLEGPTSEKGDEKPDEKPDEEDNPEEVKDNPQEPESKAPKDSPEKKLEEDIREKKLEEDVREKKLEEDVREKETKVSEGGARKTRRRNPRPATTLRARRARFGVLEQSVDQLLATIESIEGSIPDGRMDSFAKLLENVPKSSLLTMRQAERIARGQTSLWVVEPQSYSGVSLLSHNSPMFTEDKANATGLFIPSPKLKNVACSGRGCDRWWVVGRPLQRHLRSVVRGLRKFHSRIKESASTIS